MRLIAVVRSLWSNVVRRQDVERDLDAEVRAYVDLLAADYERAGMTPDLARRRALVETGGIEPVKDAARDAWVGNALASARARDALCLAHPAPSPSAFLPSPSARSR